MYPRGTIYHNRDPHLKRSLSLHAPTRVKIFYRILRIGGASLISSALTMIIISFAPVAKEELAYTVIQTNEVEQIISAFDISESAHAGEVEAVQKQAQALGVDSHFSVVIPKINAKSDITANVDTGDEKVYTEALSRGVAHAKGTFFPGQNKTIFLFSHSTSSPWQATRYSAIFYLLGKLKKDDKIIVFFADKKYEYQVTQTLVVSPTDTSWLSSGDEELLILQTCTPPGTNFKRLLVLAKPI